MIKKLLNIFMLSSLSFFIFGCEENQKIENQIQIEVNSKSFKEEKVLNREIKINESDIEKEMEYKYVNNYINIEVINDYSYIEKNNNVKVIENKSNYEQREIFMKNRIEDLMKILIEEYGLTKENFENVNIKLIHGQIIEEFGGNTRLGYLDFRTTTNTKGKDIYFSTYMSRDMIWQSIVHEFGHYIGFFVMTSENYYDYFIQRDLNKDIKYEVVNKEKEAYIKENENYLKRVEKESGLEWEIKLEETLAEDFVQMINNNEKVNQKFVNNECRTINGCPTTDNIKKLEKIIKDRLTN